MKSAKSLTSALHSFSLLSSLLFLSLFGSSAHFLLLPLHPSNPPIPPSKKSKFVSFPLVTSINIKIFLSHFLPLHPPNCSAIRFPHLSFPPLPSLFTTLLLSLLFLPYLSFSRSLLIYPHPKSPPPLTGVWAFNIQSMPPSSEPSFSTTGFDRQVPPLPPRPYRSRRMRERDAGREWGGGIDRVHPQDSGRRADRQMGESLWLWRRQAEESMDGLKDLPLLGMQGTRRQSEHSEEKVGLRNWLTAVLEFISSS